MPLTTVAERVGFEPTVELPRQQFSRLPDSAALAPLRYGRSSTGLIIEQVRTTCSMGVPSLPWSMQFCNGFTWLYETWLQTENVYGYAVEEGNDNSVNSALSAPRLTKVETSSRRSTFFTSSRRVFVLGWGGTNSLQQSWSGSIDVS